MGRFDYAGASVFVAGGTSGINLGIAEAFAEAGAAMAVMSRNAERVDEAARQLARYGGKVLGLKGDVRDFDQVRSAMEAAHGAHGPFDVLVSGAAGNFLCPAVDLSPNGFKVVVDIDLLGTFHVMRAGFDFARRPGASFINISAPQSTSPAPMQVHVCAAKAGLVTPLRDGMNLVAKEYVAAQDPEDPGVLILSRFAGSAEQMGEALLVNPFSREELSEAIQKALTMPREERIRKWKALMKVVRDTDVARWRDDYVQALMAASQSKEGSQ